MGAIILAVCLSATAWTHPAGMISEESIGEVRTKTEQEAWARSLYQTQKERLAPWLNASSEELTRVFPKRCGNVYHNFSCPHDRRRLTFDPFHPEQFVCPSCGKTYVSETDPCVYKEGDRYKGTMYDGWACIFYQTAGAVATDFAVMGRIEQDDHYTARAIELLMLYADTIEGLSTQVDASPQMNRILTYHREGDNKVLFDLACAYEPLRTHMSAAQRERFEEVALRRMLEDVMLEPFYAYDHNNIYQWHRTIVQTAIALERDDLVDWSYGYGAFGQEHLPEHRGICRLVEDHFKPDGAFWEMCSGYHLYPVHFLCEFAVLSRDLSRMDPVRFPPAQYDLTDRDSPGGRAIANALHWFLSMAMPDRRMLTIGDSPSPSGGMDDYYVTAEVGYRFFDIKEVGDYPAYREGNRRWEALSYGSPQIVQQDTPFSSSCLSSGWVSLRNAWRGNRVWAGLNALVPGGGHQHADRLGFLWYSHGRPLAIEKATPYNEGVTRTLGTLSQSHNTVTVDRESQKQGESLTDAETPRVVCFFAPASVKYAELQADHLYPQTKVYRRAVALIEQVAVDLFRVEGGSTHDWMVHHAGSAPTLSVDMTPGEFAPVDWLYHGANQPRRAVSQETWNAQWQVGNVFSRMTMLGADNTEVFALETYPIDNAVVTPENPPCQTVCVRRCSDVPFLAVWDAWTDVPCVTGVSGADRPDAISVRTATGLYYLVFGPGDAHFGDGTVLSGNGSFIMLRNADTVVHVGGTRLDVTTPQGTLSVRTQSHANVALEASGATATCEIAPPIQYGTVGGQDRYRTAPEDTISITGTLWPRDTVLRPARTCSD